MRRDVTTQDIELFEVAGMKVSDIRRMQIWWDNGNPKPFAQFWEEAFNAGVSAAKAALGSKDDKKIVLLEIVLLEVDLTPDTKEPRQ